MPKILIVDDEWLTRLEIEEMLTALGYEVVGQAETGEEAVAMARELKPDLILMDMAMPGEMNGIDAARVIKAEFGTPIIFISGYGDPAYIEAAKEIEPFGYVMKPFDETEVHAFVEIALSKRALELKLKKAHEGLERTNFILQEEIAARKERERALRESEKALRKAHDELERRVEIRTAELSKANKLLQEENEARKRSEEALRESDKRLNAILDATTETIVLFDREGIVHVANQTACDRLRTTKEEFIGKRIYDFFPPDVAEGRRQKWNEVFDTGKPVSFEDSWEGMIFAQRAYPILDDGGQVEMVTAFANDKTDRKQAEEGLRESEERYRNLVEESFDGIFIQKGPNIIFANKRLNEMLGYEEGELLGQNHWVVYHPDFQKLTRERAQVRMSGEEVVPRYEVKLQRKDGSWFYGEINAGPITFPSNQESGIQVWVKDIHVRKQAEEALRESEVFLKVLIDAIPIPVFYKDRDGKYLGFNSAFERFFGSTRKQLIGKSVFDIHPLELAETYHSKDDELFNSGEVQNYQSQWETSNGNVRDIIFNKAVFTDNEGDIRGLIGTIIDITERKRADEALQESEDRYRTLVNNLPVAVYRNTPGPEGKFLMANPAFCKMFGYNSEEEIKKVSFADLYANPEERQQYSDNLIEKGLIKNDERTLLKRDGTPVHTSITSRIVYGKDGEVSSFDSIMLDITDQRRIEEALRESEEKFRLISEQSLLAIGIIQDGRIKYGNEIYSKITGYSLEEIYGWEPYGYARTVHKDDLTFVMRQSRKKQAGDVDVITNYQFKGFTKEKEIVWWDLYSRTITYRGRPADLFTFVDITEKVKSEKDRVALEAQLHRAQKMEAMGLLAGGVAHDLNNILSGIVSYPELLLLDLPEDSPLRKPIKTIQESGMRAADVVDDLLTIARGVATGKEALNLNTIVSEYLESPEYQELDKAYSFVNFKTELDPDLLNMSGSPIHIKKILMNLVNNASEAIEGTGTVTISSMNRYLDEPLKGHAGIRTGEYAVLSVSDDGSGIAPKDLEKIFEPFYTKKVMGRTGTGLGLAVVWNTVQDHNGYINVQSSEKETAFELYFPVTRKEVSDEKEKIPLENYLGHGEKILVVDDEERQREIACGMLTKLGYNTESVSSGEEAIEYVKEHPVDLIVLDMVMPKGINGRKTYEEIIKIRPGQKAIIASGYAKTKEVDIAQRLGAGKYIKKPYILEKIGLAVKEELEK